LVVLIRVCKTVCRYQMAVDLSGVGLFFGLVLLRLGLQGGFPNLALRHVLDLCTPTHPNPQRPFLSASAHSSAASRF
jgi:hypothetical protein